MEILKSIKDSYKFLIDEYGYNIQDEENSSNLFFFVRYENRNLERVISVGIDFRENSFGISIWKSADGGTMDKDMIDFEEHLKKKGINKSLDRMADQKIDLNVIRKINKNNSDTFKKYGLGLIQGTDVF